MIMEKSWNFSFENWWEPCIVVCRILDYKLYSIEISSPQTHHLIETVRKKCQGNLVSQGNVREFLYKPWIMLYYRTCLGLIQFQSAGIICRKLGLMQC